MIYKPGRLLCGAISAFVIVFSTACETTHPRKVLAEDDDMLSMCLEGTKSSTTYADRIDTTCQLSPVSIEYVLVDPAPGSTFAKIKCQAHDEDGVMVTTTCTCQADEISGCESFARRCRDKGYEELGGGPEFSICHVNP